MNFQRTGLHPLTIFIITAILCNLADIDFRIEVGGKCHTMITGVTIYDIQIVDFIKMMFSRISCKDSRNTRIKTTT